MCPLNMLALKRNPKLIFLDKYDISSMNTSKGNKPKGHPLGTKMEKKFSKYLLIPKILAPITKVKLRENTDMKCEV